MTKIYFFDSYAIIESIRGNPRYKNYVTCSPVTTKLNIFEVYLALLRKNNLTLAHDFIKKSETSIKDFNLFIVAEAVKFKLVEKEKNLSMADCIGYVLAKNLGIPFLTGDKEFEGLPNVEFVR